MKTPSSKERAVRPKYKIGDIVIVKNVHHNQVEIKGAYFNEEWRYIVESGNVLKLWFAEKEIIKKL